MNDDALAVLLVLVPGTFGLVAVIDVVARVARGNPSRDFWLSIRYVASGKLP